ncbi:MAG: ATP-binding protein [Candidatus Hydrogenedentota bacterium]
MNYERERMLAEARAKTALNDEDWRMAAYNLFSAGRMTLRMAEAARGKTRDSLVRLAKRYEERGEQALSKADDGAIDAGKIPSETAPSGGDAQWIVAEKPTVRLADVAGMNEMKDVIERHVILPMKHADVYAEYKLRPGSGVLMYGPPGTGKTFMASAIAGEVDAAFIPVEMKKVLSKWFGETEQLLSQLFETARQYPRSVIFIDEAEALFPKRSSTNSSVMARVVPQLLQLINGFDPTKNTVILLGATNRPWLMDEAATRPGRFGKLVYVGLPDAEARAYMIDRAMAGVPVNGLDYACLAEMTEGYSGADIAGDRDSICVEAKMAALSRTIAHSDNEKVRDADPIGMGDFEAAIRRVRPSIKPGDLKRFVEFRKQHGGDGAGSTV